MRKMTFMLASLVIAGMLHAQQELEFNHASTPDNTTRTAIELADGEEFVVKIEGADQAHFTYLVTGIEIADPPGARNAGNTVVKTIEHDAKYGLYLVKVRRNSVSYTGKLEERTWYVRVNPTGWNLEIGMGLVGSRLVEPKYFLDSQDDGSKLVARDEAAEDDLDFGFASLATVYRNPGPIRPMRKWDGGLGLSLGLAITDNDFSVLAGPTLRMGKRASLTLGYNWRQIDDLTAGVALGDAFTGDALSFDSRTDGDWFVAVTIRGFTDRQNGGEVAKEVMKKEK